MAEEKKTFADMSSAAKFLHVVIVCVLASGAAAYGCYATKGVIAAWLGTFSVLGGAAAVVCGIIAIVNAVDDW